MQEYIEDHKNFLISNNHKLNFNIFLLLTLVTPIILIGGLSYSNNPPNWWHSISSAYYCNTRYLFVTIMSIIATILFSSKKVLYSIAGTCVLGLILFPTYEATLGIPTSTKVGIFNLPIILSGSIHVFINAILLVCILTILYEYVRQTKKYICLLLFLPILVSIIIIFTETSMHENGNWSYHWLTIIAEWLLFQTTGVIFLKICKNYK